jgi:hypothetical protein
MKKAFLLALMAGTMFCFSGVAQALGPGELPPAWHIHNCDPRVPELCVFPRAGVAFFPAILTGGNIDAYLKDPARCPDATDKAFLGGGAPGPSGSLNGNQPLREGVCMTSTTVIHLKSIAPDQPAPSRWTYLNTSAGFATYYMLTAP